MKLILVRHGETLWNREGRIQGTSDIELSGAGIRQAEQLAGALKDAPIDAIHASPLMRAYRTAEIINQFHGLTIETHPELIEMDQGDFEGLSFKELMACEKEFINRWIADPSCVKMPRGESLIELQNRAWPPVSDMIDRAKNTLVVSHNFTIAAILCRLRNISLSAFRSACVGTASQTVIRFEQGEPIIEKLNDREHLSDEAGS
ncbi:MAG: histidine phosphatase family protein [Smithellaceae bacterium]